MSKIKNYSPEEKVLFQIMNKILDDVKVEKEVLMTITVLINTTKKLQLFKEWVENKTEDGVIKATEAEITNVVSRIGSRRKKRLLLRLVLKLKRIFKNLRNH